ncbi:brain-specific serine protease 4-like isoform X4 [Homarus americanus]|uniref:brain-specific serine protease 4-like isoform X4 n=1 Tax=Homarus americanus TaxID=6706 RepID=UPI001C484041|nr:brain-specific serine protease 4-like isoform X4 [Homarus americanus]
MVEGRRGSVVVSQNKLLLLFFLLLALSTSPVSAQQQQQEQGRFFRGIFSLPEQCFHNGVQASCTFVLSCLMRGDTPVNKCGGSFIYTCCLPTIATVRSDAVRHINLFNRDPPPVVNNPQCGIERSTQFSKRIIGGDEANFGEFPWQAHIRISGYQCGGVLINHYFVATAAHCIHKARLDQITVHLGEFDTKDTGEHDEPLPKETFTVVEKRIHPSFKYMLTQPDRFDVAVLRLNRPVVYRDNIIPICLPDPSDDFIGEVGIVAGWGKTDNSFGKTGTNILQKVLVPVISNDDCLRWHHHKGIDVKLHFEMFCAGHSEGEMDACLGDSGGPLVIHRNGRWVLAGITSAGFGCAVDHQPGIYHKVSVTSSWVTGSVRT